MWNEGYTSEIDYTSGYYSELAPNRLKLALLSRGIDHSVPDHPTYLELGFGQGLSLNINSATNSGTFVGTDFNPGQVANARELAAAMGKQITLLEDSFEEFAARTDGSQYDIIALHGIWSWISEGSRQAIVDIARRMLKPGGIFYISYNVTPGWSPAWPLRTLLSEYSTREAKGTLVDRVAQSIDFVDRVIGADAAYFSQNPNLKARLEQIKRQDRNYIAHEYFNAHWDPVPFSALADRLAEAKLSFAASSNILENLPAISIPAAAHQVLNEIKDSVLRETARDYFVNQQFRRDIFVKGPRPIAPYNLTKRVDKERFILIGKPDACPEKIKTVAGEVDLRPEIYKPLSEALERAPENTASVEELRSTKSLSGLSTAQIWEALLVLTSAGHVAPVSSSVTPDEDVVASRALNAALMQRAEAGAGVDYLAAPKLGSATSVNRIEQLFIRALQLKAKNPVDHVWAVLDAQNQRLIVEGTTIEDEKENKAELARMLKIFEETRLNYLKKVGVF